MDILDFILTSADSKADDAYRINVECMPSAYRRVLAALQGVNLRHPHNQKLSVVRRSADATEGEHPIWFVISSTKGSFNARSYELRIPALLRGDKFVRDTSANEALMLCTPAARGDEGYVYVFPMPIGAALYSFRDAALAISDLAATLADLQPARYDTNGWLCYRGSCDIDRWYRGDDDSEQELREELESRHEVMRWYFQREKERWIKEASTPRKYVAFRSDERDDNDGRMLILGERMRPIDDRVSRKDPVRVRVSMLIRERVEIRRPYGVIAATIINAEGERVYNILDACIETPFAITTEFTANNGIVNFVIIIDDDPDVCGRLSFSLKEGESGIELDWHEMPKLFDKDGCQIAHLQDELAFAFLSEFLTEQGVREALDKGLIEPDEKDGRTVPLDRRELSSESYLSLGLDWLEAECREAIAAAPAAEETADDELTDELADWERELLGLDEEE